jgi:hypothetical protein
MGTDMATAMDRLWSKDLRGWARVVGVVHVMAILKCACRQMGMVFAVVVVAVAAAARGCLRTVVVVEAVGQDPAGEDHMLSTLVNTDGDSMYKSWVDAVASLSTYNYYDYSRLIIFAVRAFVLRQREGMFKTEIYGWRD